MGIQVESSLEPPRRSSPFAQQYGPWHYHDVRSSRYGWGEGAALISNAFSERFAGPGAEGSKSKTARPSLLVEREQQEENSTSVSTALPEVLPTILQTPQPTPSPWVFTQIHPTADHILTFPLNTTAAAALVASPLFPSRLNLKRSRPSTDVDGHNTAPLSCKKRRLRLHLVTSRLSRPFSLPATHILNRESILKGDKRLRSIAAAANRRMAMAGWGVGAAAGQNVMAMGGNGGSAWLRKMAVMNRFRMRMLGENLARAQAAQAQQTAQVQAQASGQGQVAGNGGGNVGGVAMARCGTSPRLPSGQAHASGQPGQHAPVTGFPPPVTHNNTNTNTATSSGPSTPSTTLSPRRFSPSPRLHPLRSPDLRPIDDQDFDDEDVAFPTSAHESRYEGEEEEEGHEVYADFGVLFGGSDGDDLDEDLEGNNLSGEMPGEQQEYLGLDDLDGIPWGARC
ncbi:hypothetical protein SMACR_02048 [Sordaria macrospora]|uniref:WGS project CABT00000000 data, contig 2.18 n=2 Tax=Sordaria macrospora TaxID=5147 RepID=F7W0T8_SORMK|nr:uncharacterized protein SMAC_02048 [Sordaria macrospora k-hell]KAA8632954.1 hypothetical protein SMACR_02048 [Sordaria macrospora]WPJ63873.1 hypothetical protein SMAC4_02048 [Sordaria macrospora]CCC11390.1 unnamed protein product [Sordaria macrospora k-hell]